MTCFSFFFFDFFSSPPFVSLFCGFSLNQTYFRNHIRRPGFILSEVFPRPEKNPGCCGRSGGLRPGTDCVRGSRRLRASSLEQNRSGLDFLSGRVQTFTETEQWEGGGGGSE